MKSMRTAVETALTTYFDSRAAQVEAIDPKFTEAVTALRDFTMNGGKRLRPMFAWLGYLGAVGAEGTDDEQSESAIINAFSALELIQSCALIHDDIIDASETRRGFPTVHRRFAAKHEANDWSGSSTEYGQSVAILVGDVALAWADDMLVAAGLSPAALTRAWEPWMAMRTEVLGGQLLDIALEAAASEDTTNTERVYRYKTAAYTVERPLHLGAAVANAPADIIRAYRTFGHDVGIAFQLRDDHLDIFGDPAATGKGSGDDLREGKRTVLFSTALQLCDDKDPAAAAKLRAGIGTVREQAEVDELREIIHRSGAEDIVEGRIAALTASGIAALESAPINPEIRAQLVDLAQRATGQRTK